MILWMVTFTIADSVGQTSTIVVRVSSVDLTQITDEADSPIEYARQLALYLDDVIEGKIVNISITANVSPPVGVKNQPAGGSRVERGAKIVYATIEGFRVVQGLPTFREDLLLGENVDLTDARVSALITMMTNAEELAADWTIGATNNRGTRLRLFVAGKEHHRSEID